MKREPRTERLLVTVSPSEEVIIKRAAQARGWTVSEYLRASALTCSAVDGDRAALRLVGSTFVQQVKEWFTDFSPGESFFDQEKRKRA